MPKQHEQGHHGSRSNSDDLTILRGIIDIKHALAFMFFWLMAVTAVVIHLLVR